MAAPAREPSFDMLAPFNLRVEFRNRVPAMVLHELAGGEYQPVVGAAAGSRFVMTDPFAFSIDPGELLDDDG